MDLETKTALRRPARVHDEEPLRRAPTLYIIIFFKLAKGLGACALAVALCFQTASLLPSEYQHLLARPWVVNTFHYLRIHPENKFFTDLAKNISNVTDAGVREAAIGALLWSLFPLTEGIGMMFRARWAGLLAIGESAFFVPVEMYKLAERFSWFMVGVAIVNIGIVWYLYVNRDRLFHEPQHHFHLRRQRT